MPSFDIVKQCDIDKTYRVARIMGDYDVKTDHAKEHFTGNIDLPDDWQIGVIWGGQRHRQDHHSAGIIRRSADKRVRVHRKKRC